MAKYCALYSDFVLCDGTHNVTKYVMKLMPFTIVDALGRNTLVGIALDYSENSTVVTNGLKTFSLGSSHGTLMTDGGSAYPGAASACGMTHVLCTKHFHADVLQGCSGLAQLSNDFKRDCFTMIYTGYREDDFIKRFAAAEETYAPFPVAASALKKIWNHRHKTLALDELISCVQNKCLWSPYVDRQWKQNYDDMHKYPHVQQQGDVWGVSEHSFVDMASVEHCVTLGASDEAPSSLERLNLAGHHQIPASTSAATSVLAPAAGYATFTVDMYQAVVIPPKVNVRVMKVRNALARMEQAIVNDDHLDSR
ncbi:hypothetical protein H257_14555 [Aphanomyces astaci]|uniref:Uncharacterized protein n=1 Tax=Aphanomyces astaci TaxID=112090 RepID=W4FQD5_APHAT|nr:hypothetical protein H257_14555 [Aphanomyces astaci]ETV69692.1 hypothetical protein H257_14555 [Aphanomyces astaci]|eukprot:XP_009840706.1 hypothetical protein H257_14555 [Aphanomyces astaci]